MIPFGCCLAHFSRQNRYHRNRLMLKCVIKYFVRLAESACKEKYCFSERPTWIGRTVLHFVKKWCVLRITVGNQWRWARLVIITDRWSLYPLGLDYSDGNPSDNRTAIYYYKILCTYLLMKRTNIPKLIVDKSLSRNIN